MSQREVEKAIDEMNDKMAARDDDDVPGNALKLRGEGLRIITQLRNIVREIGEWPKDFTEVIAIALKKKPKATKYRDHRTVSLNEHTAKMATRKNVEYFNYLCIMRTNSVRRAREIKPRLPRKKQKSTRRRVFSPANWTQI
jgi:hypothetical protein